MPIPQPLKVLIAPLALLFSSCGDSIIEPGTPVTSWTICTRGADEFDCFDREVQGIVLLETIPSEFAGVPSSLDSCITTYPTSDVVAVGDRVELRYQLLYGDGTRSGEFTYWVDVDDTAVSIVLNCND